MIGGRKPIDSFEPFEALETAAGTYKPTADGSAQPIPGSTNLTHAVPGVESGTLESGRYRWEPWNEPDYVERRKAGYGRVQAVFDRYRGA